MCANRAIDGSAFHLTMNVHKTRRGSVYWAVLARRPKQDVLLASGTLEDPYPAEVNVRGSVLMECAYAAYEALGRSSSGPQA